MPFPSNVRMNIRPGLALRGHELLPAEARQWHERLYEPWWRWAPVTLRETLQDVLTGLQLAAILLTASFLLLLRCVGSPWHDPQAAREVGLVFNVLGGINFSLAALFFLSMRRRRR